MAKLPSVEWMNGFEKGRESGRADGRAENAAELDRLRAELAARDRDLAAVGKALIERGVSFKDRVRRALTKLTKE